MKKIILLLGVMLISICALSSCALLYIGGTLATELVYTEKEDGTYSVSAGPALDGESLTIPEEFGGIAVTEIAAYGFKDCATLKTVVVPESIKRIGKGAFEGCSSLEKITVPFVGEVERKASAEAEHFGYIFGAETDSQNADFLPEGLKTVIISGGSRIVSHAFLGCSNITSVTVPESVTFMGRGAFSGCTSLRELTTPFVGKKRQQDNTDYTLAYLFTEWLSSYDNNATDVPESLVTVTLTDGTFVDHNGAFRGCRHLREINFPDGFQTISNEAFKDCTALESVEIPDSVSSIGNGAFKGCTALHTVTVSEKTLIVGNNAFEGCTSLTRVKLKDGLYAIRQNAFAGCTALANIVIPRSVESMGNGVFKDCTSLAYITVPFIGDKPSDTIDYYLGYIFGAKSRDESAEAVPESLKSVTVDARNVEYISYVAFQGCAYIEEVSISGVKKIDVDAFKGCTSLKKVTIEEGLITLKGRAFENAHSLETVALPLSITNIGSGVFSQCYSLQKIYYEGTMDEWRAVTKNFSWRDGMPNCIIVCRDGEIRASES